VVRYEELVLRTEPLLRELLDWLGEPWSPNVLAPHTLQAARGGRVTVEGRSRVDEPIDAARVARWTERMSDADRAVLRRRLGRLGEFYGYDVDDPLALAPLRKGALVARGADIEARIDRFPALDLRTEGAVPLADRFYDPRRVKLRPAEPRGRGPRPSLSRRAALAAWRRLPDRTRGRLRPLAQRVAAHIR
jgi:hypothetical protein